MAEDPDGAYWVNGPADYQFWTRYLSAFDEVKVVARVRTTTTIPKHYSRVDGPAVIVHKVAYYRGHKQMLQTLPRVIASIWTLRRTSDVLLLRMPSNLSNVCWAALTLFQSKPYAVELVGDATTLFSSEARSLRRALYTINYHVPQLLAARSASAVAYVTPKLRQKYPANKLACTEIYSSVEIPDASVRRTPRIGWWSTGKILLVATLTRRYKDVGTALRAIRILHERGHEVKLTVAGGGALQQELELLAASLGIEDSVQFLGQVRAGRPIMLLMDAHDVLIIPSLSEGLPRVALEAMARGLPVFSTPVGGLPDVTHPSALFSCGNSEELANRIAKFLEDGPWRDQLSLHGLDTVLAYQSSELNPRRQRLYAYLRDQALAQRAPGVGYSHRERL